ncbi:hypothetical protein Tco_1218872 [Tanacetum coccineum]
MVIFTMLTAKELLVHKQTLGVKTLKSVDVYYYQKLIDSLLKTIWFINAPCYYNEALASPNSNDEELSIPEQTATGKGTSNPLMAGSLPKTTKPTEIEESLNVTFDETPPPAKTSPLVDDDLDEEEAISEIEKKNLENNVEDETVEIDEVVNIKESRNLPLENGIGNLNQRTLRSQAQNQRNFYCFISTIEPKNVNEALGDKNCIESHA